MNYILNVSEEEGNHKLSMVQKFIKM